MANKLTILLVNRWLGYNYGGNESIMRETIKGLSRKGHKMVVVTTRGTALEESGFELVEKHYVNAPKGYYTYGTFGLFYSLFFLFKSFAVVSVLIFRGYKFNLQAVHFSLEGILARIVRMLYAIPYVYVTAGDTYLEMIEGKRADKVIHISHFMYDIGKQFGHDAVVIPIGMDSSRFSPTNYSEELTQKYKTDPATTILLTVCRLDPRKNLITLIEAVDIMVKKYVHPNIVLLIIGDGIERDLLTTAITARNLENYIKLLGRISDTELPSYFASSDIFVLPTLYETFGIVYTEAMASGLPVITCRVGSAPEVVGNAGLLVSPRNPQELADSVYSLLSDKTKLLQLKSNALARAKKYDWKTTIDKYEKVYVDTSSVKCGGISSRLQVLGYLLIDSFSIIKQLFGGVLFSDSKTKNTAWDGAGQAGLKQ